MIKRKIEKWKIEGKYGTNFNGFFKLFIFENFKTIFIDFFINELFNLRKLLNKFEGKKFIKRLKLIREGEIDKRRENSIKEGEN